MTPAVRALIRDQKIEQIPSMMQAGKKHGMQTLNDALYQLYVGREVTKDECLRVTSTPNEFLRMIGEAPLDRSEERRVGKECRSRWSPYNEKKKQRRGQRRRTTKMTDTCRSPAGCGRVLHAH